MQTLQIILPCYNPIKDWEKIVVANYEQIKAQLPADVQLKIAVVNDAATHGLTEAHIEALKSHIEGFDYFTYPANRGKGYAIRYALQHLQADWYIYTDIDFPYTIQSLLSVADSLRNGADVAAGVRDEMYYVNVPQIRTIISKILRLFFNLLFHIPITDTQCGLKGFNEVGKQQMLATTIERFLFDMEFIIRVNKQKEMLLKPVSVELKKGITFSKMSFGVLLKEFGNFIRLLYMANR